MNSSACPVCGSEENKVSGKPKTNSISVKLIDRDYRVVQCTICRAYYVSPGIKFSDEQWGQLYHSEYFPKQSPRFIRRRKKELNQRFNKAEELLHQQKNIRFLDIGTGEGKTLIEGLKRSWDVTGIDIVDNRIDEAKEARINFIKAKFLEHEFPENSFDLIYLDSVLEHVLTPVEYLNKVKKILKPGGIIYIGVPNEDSLFNDVRRLAFNLTGKKEISEKIVPFVTPYHVIGFNYNSLNYIIKKVGLTLVQLRNVGRKFEFLSCRPTERTFWINLIFLFPVEVIGYLTKRDVYFELYLTKDNS